jgi:hypothetical protein
VNAQHKVNSPQGIDQDDRNTAQQLKSALNMKENANQSIVFLRCHSIKKARRIISEYAGLLFDVAEIG